MSAALETLEHAFKEQPKVGEETLFMGAQPSSVFLQSIGWQPMKNIADQCTRGGMQLVDQVAGEFSQVLFLPGKSREETIAGFVAAYDVLQEGGILWVSLANDSGASRYEKELRKATPILQSISKNKCRTFMVRKDEWDEAVLQDWQKIASSREIESTAYTTQPGVFSSGKIDVGSALLVQHLPSSLHGKIADLGAGWGFLSDQVLQKAPGIEQIDLFEADARALACARKNVRGNAKFYWHDVTQGIEGKYHYVIMNPPFHTGKKQDIDLGFAFLESAVKALRPGGSLYVVANRQLPYEAKLQELGLRVRKIAENSTFKVLFCS